MTGKRLEEQYGEMRKTVSKAIRGYAAGMANATLAKRLTDGELEDAVLCKAVGTVMSKYDESRATEQGGAVAFVGQSLWFESKKAVAREIRHVARFGTPIDTRTKTGEGFEGGEDSQDAAGKGRQRPLSEVYAAKEVVPGGLRGAKRIYAECELSLLREMLSREDWTIFALRFRHGLSNVDTARRLGWSVDRLKRHLKGYARRLARLFDVSPSRR